MKIDHMIFNSKKYWEGTAPNYIGRKVKAPKNLLYGWSYGLYTNFVKTTNSASYDGYSHCKPDEGETIIGQGANNDGEVMLMTKSTSGNLDWFTLTDLVQNGGVSSSPLTHLYQGLRHLLDRKVALVND